MYFLINQIPLVNILLYFPNTCTEYFLFSYTVLCLCQKVYIYSSDPQHK